MRKRILSLILVLVLFSTVPLTVRAHDVPDFERTGSISIAMTYRGKPVSGGSLTIYKVADVAEQDGDMMFVYTEDFSECTIAVTELDSASLPQELARMAVTQRVSGTTQRLDRLGKTKFSDLEIGLYLVVQGEAAPGYSAINPFLVSVPQMEDGVYVYDVDTAPKNIPEPKPTESKPAETTKPNDSNLPQTGQTNWPVPVLAASGMLMIAAGLCMMNAGKKKQDEA